MMVFSRTRILLAASAALCLSLPSHGQRLDMAVPLQMIGADSYQQLKGAMGVVLLSVNWNPRTNCGGFESAQLLGLSFDQVPNVRRDDDPGDLSLDEPQGGHG